MSAACLASRGHEVVGVDVDARKAAFIRAGRSPIVEDGISELIADVAAAGTLTVSDDPVQAVLDTDVTIVCVGTPSGAGGSVSTVHLERVTEQIAAALAAKDGWHVVVLRSTMAPGTCEQLLVPLLENVSGKTVGQDFGVCVNPVFLREGTSVQDFLQPPKTVVGESDARSGELVMSLYEGLPGPRFRVPIAVAEMTKYVDNGFHALKVAFANEIGSVCAATGIDSHAVMDVFLADTELNMSPAYLLPGFAFGGSSLPKDLRALTYTARRHDVDVPVLSNVLVSNEMHLRRAVDLITSFGRRRIGIFGLSFKAGTGDLRESPLVELAERLAGKGYDLRIFDPHVSFSRPLGSNSDYVDKHLPHISGLLTDDASAVLDHAEVCVVGSRDPQVVTALTEAGPACAVVDLVRLPDAVAHRGSENYAGIAW